MEKKDGAIVISLFDGMSCGQLAFKKLGIKVKEYYASEIDKHAIQVTQHNFTNTKQIGDVSKINTDELPFADYVIGGSPCQSFSFAGKRKGMATKDNIEILSLDHYLKLKNEGFEFEGQSYLFWEYMRILTAVKKKNPNVKFLLENVVMGSKWQRVLSQAIGTNPILINSALLSAQNRERLYWTNIYNKPAGLFDDLVCMIPQPKDKGILLKDILEIEVAEKYFLSEKMINYLNTRKANYNSGKINYKTGDDVASCINASSGHIDISDNIIIDTNRKSRCFTAGGHSGGLHSQMDLIRVNKNNLVKQINPSKESGGLQPYQQNRIYDCEGISPAPLTEMSSGTHAILTEGLIRRLTPTECERLQTVPDGYTNVVSDTQRYRMLGNGWTIDVIVYILSFNGY